MSTLPAGARSNLTLSLMSAPHARNVLRMSHGLKLPCPLAGPVVGPLTPPPALPDVPGTPNGLRSLDQG